MGKRLKTAEISFSRYLDEDEWTVSTNDKATAARIERMGWLPESPDGPYWTFVVPEKAATLRSRKTVEGFKRHGGASAARMRLLRRASTGSS